LRRISRTTLGAIGGGVLLAATLFVGFAPSGAGAASSTIAPITSKANVAAAPSNPLAPLEALPISISLPISLLANEIAGMLLPGQDAQTGTNVTTQTSPLANVTAPINACSISAGILAGAKSSCSTTSVGLNQKGAIANVNVPITAQDNAVGLLGEAASALGLNTSTTSASTTQTGAINAAVPVTLCSIDVGLVGDTASACNTAGTNGTTTQKGVIDADVPVTVCDVIVEIADNATASCPTNPDTTSQAGELADLYVPAGICGVIVQIDGKATGDCMPTSDFSLTNGLPVNSLTQSAPIDGVLPVNACSIVVAIDGSGTTACEPSHVAPTQTGVLPISGPVTVCAVTAALEGTADGTCTGSGGTGVPIGLGGAGSGVSLPITLCGIEGALGGTADASCPQPTTSAATTPTTPSAPVTLASTTPAAAAAPAKGALAFTGAPLVLELAIALMALAAGWAMTLLARRQRKVVGRPARHAAPRG
jgi:hypothetical protein